LKHQWWRNQNLSLTFYFIKNFNDAFPISGLLSHSSQKFYIFNRQNFSTLLIKLFKLSSVEFGILVISISGKINSLSSQTKKLSVKIIPSPSSIGDLIL